MDSNNKQYIGGGALSNLRDLIEEYKSLENNYNEGGEEEEEEEDDENDNGNGKKKKKNN